MRQAQLILEDPYHPDSQAALSAAVEEYVRGGGELEKILGFRSLGFNSLSARHMLLKQKRGKLLYDTWISLGADRAASDLLFNYINGSKPPLKYTSTISQIKHLGVQTNAKATSSRAFYQRLRYVESQLPT